jgi:putative addiction module component (TIGR02574 family)
MSDLLKKIEHDALSLSQQERAFLADRLLSSLDDNVLNDIEAEWIAEAEHRYQEFKEGKHKGISAQDVCDETDRILK